MTKSIKKNQISLNSSKESLNSINESLNSSNNSSLIKINSNKKGEKSKNINIKKGKWSLEEDKLLKQWVEQKRSKKVGCLW